MTKNIKQLNHQEAKRNVKQFPILIFAHDLNHPANVGGLFRLSDAFGVEKLYLSGSTLVPPNRKVNRASRATEKYVPFEYITNPKSVLEQKKSEGYKIVSLEWTNNSIDLSEFCQQSHEKIALIIGSEIKGVEDDLLALSDAIIHISMYGQNSSLNVAMATGIAVYQISQALQ